MQSFYAFFRFSFSVFELFLFFLSFFAYPIGTLYMFSTFMLVSISIIISARINSLSYISLTIFLSRPPQLSLLQCLGFVRFSVDGLFFAQKNPTYPIPSILFSRFGLNPGFHITFDQLHFCFDHSQPANNLI